jgi:hypothetical protein
VDAHPQPTLRPGKRQECLTARRSLNGLRHRSTLQSNLIVLQGSLAPLRARDIWRAAEVVLGTPIPKSSAYEALATHARTKDRRFQRVGYGLYEYRYER